MHTRRLCVLWSALLLAGASRHAAAESPNNAPNEADTADVTGGVTSPEDEDALHVHLHNATHGALVDKDGGCRLDVAVLVHNASHSLLHMNCTKAGLHRDVLMDNDVMADLDLGSDPVNRSHTHHDGWSGHDELVPTEGGWVSTETVNSSTSDRRQTVEAAGPPQQDSRQLTAALLGAAAGVVLIAAGAVWVIRSRRKSSGTLLGEEDEEFTVFSVVDHPYKGKRADDYSPIR